MLARIVSLAIIAWLSAAHAARAESDACIDHHERTQSLRRDYRYIEARDDALRCAQVECPRLIRADCQRWYGELERLVPTIVFAVQDGRGNDLTDVKVFAGEELLLERLDGRALPFDPGPLSLRFEAEGHRPATLNVTAREGEQGRVVELTLPALELATLSTPELAPAPAVAPVQTAPARRGHRFKAAVISLAAIGAVGAAGVIGFGIAGKNDEDALRRGCAPDCAPGAVDDVQRKYLLADISLGVAATALVGAAVLYFVGREPRVRVDSALSAHGGILTVRSSF